MIGLAKRYILRSLNNAGYRLLKRAEHEELLRVRETQPVPNGDLTDLALSIDESELLRFLKGADGLDELPPLRTLALYSAVRYLTRAGVEGDVVDCGHGGTATLSVLARAFLHFGDTSRRVVLFDTTADPLHRPDVDLELWGTDRDLLSAARGSPRPRKVEPAPPELASTGYPIEKVSVRRYPREAIAQSEPVAFLGLTSQTYESNRTAIATFLPYVSRGGVVAVEADGFNTTRRNAVDEFLRSVRVNLFLVRVAPNYQIGVKP